MGLDLFVVINLTGSFFFIFFLFPYRPDARSKMWSTKLPFFHPVIWTHSFSPIGKITEKTQIEFEVPTYFQVMARILQEKCLDLTGRKTWMFPWKCRFVRLSFGGFLPSFLPSFLFSNFEQNSDKLTSLTSILMSGNGLQSLSKQIENLQHLTLLDLSNNELSEIPQEIGLPFFFGGWKRIGTHSVVWKNKKAS